MAQVFIVRYPEAPVRIPEKGKVSIGRAENCDVMLPEARASRQHAIIEWRQSAGGFVLADLGSSNGTFLNGAKIGAMIGFPIKNWDKFRIASSVFTVRFVNSQDEIDNEFMQLRRRIHHQVTEVINVTDIKRMQSSPAIAGDLTHLFPIELFQMLEVGQKTGVLTLQSPLGEGRFSIRKGNIITARFKDLQGEKAVYETLRCACGPFEFLPQQSLKDRPEIALATTALLMEGCRLMDENTEAAQKK